MKDLKLRPYYAGTIFHHEALDGSGYPKGLTKKDIPIEGQIIRVADEFDAIASKRQYKSHIDISDTLLLLKEDATALSKKHDAKINPKILKALIKVIIDDIEYEKYCVKEYVEYLEQNIKRLNQIHQYAIKMKASKKQKDQAYYENGIKLLLSAGETIENYITILEEYEQAKQIRDDMLKKLDTEIKKIKKMKV
ncbi:MAG: hypothetical protein HFJ27_00955 [Clostridia bacterium]|nr:hypothetical protein [Clostridia bacterium]